ncbi:MAG: hypothetical protein ACFFB2_01765 [Promethearchaeota archaeon]
MQEKGKLREIVESLKNRISKTAEEELDDEIAFDDRVSSIVIIVVGVLIGLYFVTHQIGATGFFTVTFGMLEMFFLYGFFIFWITTSTLILLGHKNPSRDLDSFGGLFFATVSIAWLFVVFPFEFAYFADILPAFLGIFVKWISNDIARVLLVLLFFIHIVAAVYSLVLRLFVRKVRAQGKR